MLCQVVNYLLHDALVCEHDEEWTPTRRTLFWMHEKETFCQYDKHKYEYIYIYICILGQAGSKSMRKQTVSSISSMFQLSVSFHSGNGLSRWLAALPVYDHLGPLERFAPLKESCKPKSNPYQTVTVLIFCWLVLAAGPSS